MARKRNVVNTMPQLEFDPATHYAEFDNNITITDEEFASSQFLPTVNFFTGDQDTPYAKYIYRSVSDRKFMNTSLGGHIAVNMPYSYTRHADIPRKGRDPFRDEYVTNRFSPNLGMGRYYADTIENFSKPRVLTMEFGVPQHRSPFAFFTEAISFSESIIATEGRSPFAYNIGKYVSAALIARAFPLSSALVYGLGLLKDLFIGPSDPRYYTFKPTMHTYMQSADSIFKSLLIERGVLKLESTDNIEKDTEVSYGAKVNVNKDYIERLRSLIPALFNKNGDLDLFYIVSRPNLIAKRMLEAEIAQESKGSSDQPIVTNKDGKDSSEYIEAILKLDSYKASKDAKGRPILSKEELPGTANIKASDYKPGKDGISKRLPHDKNDFYKNAKKAHDIMKSMALDQVSFYVDYVGESSYSFNNETKDIPAKSVMNSVGGKFRDIRFSMGGSDALGNVVGDVIKAGRDVVMGGLEGASFGLSNVVTSLMGGGYISFPKMWSDSSASLPSHTFKITLGGPYGGPISQVMDIDVVLSMLLAAALPQGLGRASYTSPFLCRAFIRGVIDIDFGMITSLNVNAGTGVLGRDINGAPLQVEVTFTIADFSDVVTARVNTGVFGAYGLQYDEYSSLNRVLRTIAGRDYRHSRFVGKNFKYRLKAAQLGLSKLTDPMYYTSLLNSTAISELWKIGELPNQATIMYSTQ